VSTLPAAEYVDAPSRSWVRAFGDLSTGWGHRELWSHLGWQDIKQRYRRSVLGPIWITISMAVTAVALGLLYSQLFGLPLAFFLPYVTVGFIVWGFIQSCINDGSAIFISNEGLIRHLPAPISVHVYRMVWRNILFFAHNLIVYFVMLAIFHNERFHVGWGSLLAIPAFALLVVNGMWVGLLMGVVATRFRDIPPVTESVIQLMFFMTPIVWVYDDLLRGPKVPPGARLVEFNPFLHFVEIIRRPMLGQSFEPRYWVVAIAITIAGWLLALVFLRNYRARIAYWV
jgi:homopolymeric O-antigen transport system permease protein